MTAGDESVSRRAVARGAALAGVAKAAGLIEALSQPLFIWLFGLATYGIYVVLWGAINLVSNIIDLSMTSALQREIPSSDNEEQAHATVKFALLVSVVPAVVIALLITLNAEAVAGLFSTAPEDRERLPQAVAIFAWALPLWTFVEVATSAVRARRAFGPEIRLRVFWEQIARILFALLFFSFGFRTLGLMAAHLSSLALTAVLCLPLLGRFYDLKRLARAPISRGLARRLLATGLALLPSTLTRRLLIDAPPVILNLMLPGTRGAVAAALFEIARKIATVPLIVRQAFQYVMAPLSSAQAHADRSEMAPLYRFASRVSTALVVPLAGLLVFAGADILSVYRAEASAALPLLYVLVVARAVEAMAGPASAIVEMTGHRILPLVNSAAGVALGAVLAIWLVPAFGAMGMAVATASAMILIAYASALELKISDGLSPFDSKLLRGLAIALAGVGLMAIAEHLFRGPARFASVLLLWAAGSWCALRFGLIRSDREALGSLGRRLRLAPPRATH